MGKKDLFLRREARKAGRIDLVENTINLVPIHFMNGLRVDVSPIDERAVGYARGRALLESDDPPAAFEPAQI